MSFSSSPLRSRVALTLAAGASLALILTGCAQNPSEQIPEPGQTPGASSAATDAPGTPAPSDATSTPDPSEAPEPESTPFAIACDSLLSAQAVYDYNPNFGADPGYAPAAGTLPASVADLEGTACAWLNQSSGEVIEIAVAQPSEARITALKNEAVAASAAVPTYGVPPEFEGYFAVVDGAGEAQLFTGGYWLVARSSYFIEPGDVGPLFEAAVAQLP